MFVKTGLAAATSGSKSRLFMSSRGTGRLRPIDNQAKAGLVEKALPQGVPAAAAAGIKLNPSFPAACTSERTPLTRDSPTFSWAPTKTTVSLGPKGNRGFRGRGGAAEGTSIRVYTDTSDPQLVTTTSRTVFRAAFLEKVACQFLSIDKPLFRLAQTCRFTKAASLSFYPAQGCISPAPPPGHRAGCGRGPAPVPPA